MYFIAVALTAAVFINERKQGLLDRSLVASIYIFISFLFRLKPLFPPQFYGAHHMFTNQENKDLQICITYITFLLSFAISRCPNDRNYVGPFGQSVYRSGRTRRHSSSSSCCLFSTFRAMAVCHWPFSSLWFRVSAACATVFIYYYF